MAQLYDMQADPGDTNNFYEERPEVARQLLVQLKEDIRRGRSTAGPDQTNDVDNIMLWKSGKCG